MTAPAGRPAMRAAGRYGDRVMLRPGPAGVRRLPGPAGRDPRNLRHDTGRTAGRPLRRAPIAAPAPRNLPGAAAREGPRPPAQRGTAGG
jgi:hypothetical protein